jgi:hypothetical protein
MARPNAAFSLLHVSLVAAKHMDEEIVDRLIWPMTGVEHDVTVTRCRGSTKPKWKSAMSSSYRDMSPCLAAADIRRDPVLRRAAALGVRLLAYRFTWD